MRISICGVGIFALSLAVGLSTTKVAAQPGQAAFNGTLAQKEIVFQFLSDRELKDREEIYGKQQQQLARYFYRSIGRIIPLIKVDDEWLVECQTDFHGTDCAKPTGYWLLPIRSSNDKQTILPAKWKAAKNAPVLDVHLTAVQLDTDSKLDAWNQLLGTGVTKLMPLPKRSSVVVGVLTDTRSKVKVPQLISGYSSEVMERFNKKMRLRLVHDAAARLENISMDGGEEDSNAIQFQSPRWLVWGGGGGGYYGGNHGLYAYSFAAFDMKTGEEVDIRTALFLHLSDKTLERYLDKSNYVRVPNKWLKNQRVVESLVLKEIKRTDSAGKSNPFMSAYQIQEACTEDWKSSSAMYDDDDGEMVATKWNRLTKQTSYSFGFELMPQFDGLAVVSNDFPEVSRGCRGIMFTIPWNRVKPYLKQPL